MSFSESFQLLLKYLNNYYMEEQLDYYQNEVYLYTFESFFLESDYEEQYFSVVDYFYINSGISFEMHIDLDVLMINKSQDEQIIFIESLINLLKSTRLNRELNDKTILKISSMLNRYNYSLHTENGTYKILSNSMRKEGYFCNVEIINDFLVRKRLKKDKETKDNISRLKAEYKMMEKLSQSPDFINVYPDESYENSYLMDRCDCNLYEYMRENILNDGEKISIIKEIIDRLIFAENQTIWHRDLHPGNILILNKSIRVCDFGLAKDSTVVRSLMTSYGVKNNHSFVSPEGMKNFQDVDLQSDIFSAGKIIDFIMNDCSFGMSNMFTQVVLKATQYNPKNRYTSFIKMKEAIESLLQVTKAGDDIEYVLSNIISNKYSEPEIDLLEKYALNDELSLFIVSNKFSDLHKAFNQAPLESQFNMINSIHRGFVDATGYRGFGNYDIFADFAYNLLIDKEIDEAIKLIAANILFICAGYRFYAKNLANKIVSMTTIKQNIKLILNP